MQLLNVLNYLPHRLPGVMVGITISASGNFDERELDYMAAVVYPQHAKLPRLLSGMVSYELAPQTMAHLYAIWISAGCLPHMPCHWRILPRGADRALIIRHLSTIYVVDFINI